MTEAMGRNWEERGGETLIRLFCMENNPLYKRKKRGREDGARL